MAMKLDERDRAILNALQEGGRISNVDLAQRIGLSPPATHVRLKRLEEEGYIEEYVARLDRNKLGFTMLCYMHIGLKTEHVEELESVRNTLRDMPEVLECSFITGEYDYLLKVALKDWDDLERFLLRRVSALPAVERISTSMVISEVKSSTALPILQEE